MSTQSRSKQSQPKQETVYREVTWEAVVLGIIQGVIMNLAFVYSALKLGFSVGGSTVAAILGYALLKGVLGKGTSVENNINQTIASGINTAGTGIVFTLPAIFLLSAQGAIDGEIVLWPFALAGVAGTLLGITVIIPLRKQMIDLDRLRYPSGVAVATIIRSGAEGLGKAKLLGIGFLISALWKVILITGWLDVPGIFEFEEFNFGFGMIPDYLSPLLYLSLMNIGAGMLAGRGGLPLLWGALLAWWVVSPVAVSVGWAPLTEAGLPDAGAIYGKMIRPLGIGALIGGALMGVVMAFPAIKGAVRSLINASKNKKSGSADSASDEMPAWILGVGGATAIALFFTASYMVSGVSLGQAVLVALIAPIWLAVAALIVAQATGMTDISPMSGMALISVTIMMFVLDKNVAAALVVGLAVSVAAGLASDMMQDLKTGYLIGGVPIRQQSVQFAFTWVGALIAIGTVVILWKGGGGFGPGTSLPAPQAGVLTGIVQALQSGSVPIDKYVMGGTVGALLGLAPMAGLGVLVGLAMYLPFSINFSFGLGCLIQMAVSKVKGRGYAESKIVPIAAGFIIGEALVGITHSFIEVMKSL